MEIVGDVLSTIREGPLIRTRVMYKSNLDSKSLEKYLDFLVSAGFVSAEKGRNDHTNYSITPKGVTFLDSYLSLSRALESAQGHLEVPS
jgi:predicted transcriptional regulator